MLKRIIYISITLLFCISTANAKLFEGEEFYLNNGMRVIVLPNHKAPIVAHQVWYKIGAADDPTGKAGTAHLLEHLMFKGTKKIKDFDKIITENGGDGNAMTSYDYTAYHQKLDISKLELAMFLEADRMKNLTFDQEEFSKERDVVFNERKQVVENNPASEFYETFRRSLWQTHPYARPVIGTSAEIMGLNLSDAKTFYQNYYTPGNATLIISGDIDIATAKTLAKKYYEPIPDNRLKPVTDFPDISSGTEFQFEMRFPNIQTPRYYQSYIVKSREYALEILAKYLGEGKTSALYKSLVIKQKALLDISTSYMSVNRSYGSFSISALLKKEQDPSQIISKEMDKLVSQMSNEDLAKTKEKMLSGLIFLKDNPFDAAYLVGYMSVTMSLAEINAWADNINAVTLTEVKSAYQALKNATNQIGLLYPEK